MDTSTDPHALYWRDPRLRAILDNVADGIIAIDARGAIELFNPAAERLFGYFAPEVLGHNVSILMPSPHRDRHDEFISRYLNTGERRIIGIGREVAGRRKDGSTFPLYLSVGEVSGGEQRRFIGILHDLSLLKQKEKELVEVRKYLQNIIDSMPSTLVGLDPDGRVTHWNQVAAERTGVSFEEAAGHHFTDFFPHLTEQMEEVRRAIAERRPRRTERWAIPDGGETRFADVVVYPLVANGARGAVMRIDDVTDRVRIDEMMVQTEKMMSVGGLAAGMAHEINNPLGIIAQGCQNFLRRISDEIPRNLEVAEEVGVELDQVRAYLEKRGIFQFISGIQEAVTRAARIIADMLDYSRRSSSSFAPVSLIELVETVLRLASHDYDLKKSYDFRSVAIERDYQMTDDTLFCEQMAIEQVLLNLVRNATQAMTAAPGHNPPQLRVQLREEGDRVRIEISDNGPGMDSETRRRLFEPFFTTRPGVGTGLGLSVAYFIITEQHRGSLDVESTPGQGARFIIRLPREGGAYGSGHTGRG
jgi:PAS domain S-box-containing protein